MIGPVDELHDQLATTATTAVYAAMREHIEIAITLGGELSGPDLLEYPVCDRRDLPERIVDHNCRRGSTSSQGQNFWSSLFVVNWACLSGSSTMTVEEGGLQEVDFPYHRSRKQNYSTGQTVSPSRRTRSGREPHRCPDPVR